MPRGFQSLLLLFALFGPVQPAVSQDDTIVRQRYSGPEMPDSLAFMSLLHSTVNVYENDEPVGDTTLYMHWMTHHMRCGDERARVFGEKLRRLHTDMHNEAETAVVDSVCVPEATEWWPDTQALEALDRIGVIREAVYQTYYEDLLGSLSDRDKLMLMNWLEESKGSFSRVRYAESYADRPEEAQDILRQFCRSRTDR